MKISLFYCLIIFLIFASCKLKNENKSIEEADALTISQTTDTLPSCFSRSKIYGETAFLWQASWVTYYDKIVGEKYSNSPQLNFDEINLDSLFSEVQAEKFPGVMLWYIMLEDGDPYPSLAMQNTISCNVDIGGSIIMAPWNEGPVVHISQDSLEAYKTKWELGAVVSRLDHTLVNGYNYSWNSLIDLMDNNPAPEGFYVNYGLRTIEPTEAEYLTPSLTNKTGSVVYCNVLYDTKVESAILGTLEDFALPCPEYCGNN